MKVNKLKRYDAYKPSGVEWLGEIPEHWEVKRLKNIASIKARIGFHGLNSTHFIESGAYCITGTDFIEGRIDFSNCYKVSEYWYELDKNIQIENGDLLITKDGTIGKIALVDNLATNEKATLNSGVFVLRTSLLAKNLFWQLISGLFTTQTDLISRGSTINHLYERDFRNFTFIQPPVSEQTAIAQFLDTKTALIDKAIALKEKQIALLKERRQAIIHQAVTKGLNPDVSMKDSGIEWIGKIPVHWEVKKLKYLLAERNEKSKEGKEPLFMVSQTHGLVVRADFHSKAEVASSTEGNKIVYKGDLVFNKLKAHLGVFYKSTIEYRGLVSPDYAVYYSKGIIQDLKYLELLFRCPEYLKEFICRARGIVEGLIRLYTSDLFNIEVSLPPNTEQEKILKFIELTTSKISNAVLSKENEIEKLKEYKASLINSAVTGKIKVA